MKSEKLRRIVNNTVAIREELAEVREMCEQLDDGMHGPEPAMIAVLCEQVRRMSEVVEVIAMNVDIELEVQS